MNRLRIATRFALPVNVAGEAIAVLAKRGAGKTNTGRVLAEELNAASVQFVVLDPVSAWWGLRSSADGKTGGLTVPVFGGAHGDVPLQATAGALLADVVVDTGQSVVLDLSDFSKTEQRRFVTDFAERLYQRKARDRTLLHVILEEDDEFAPQRVNAGDARMVGSIEQLIAHYPAALSKEQLADLAGASATSSAFTNNLGSLRSLGLIDYPRPGEVTALPILFLEAAA